MTDEPLGPGQDTVIEDGPESAPDALQARLASHFAAEIHRAERDVRRGWLGRPVPAEPRRIRRRRLAAIGAVLTTAVIITGVLGMQSGRIRTVGASPTRPTGVASTVPTPSAAVVGAETYPDGIPTSIDGVPVLRGSGISDHIASVTDDSPFLVAGYPVYIQVDCAAPSPRLGPLDPGCGDGYHLADVPDSRDAFAGPLLHLTEDLPATGAAVVLRVHAHDPLAAGCDRCQALLVVQAVLWRDGRLVTQPASGQIQDFYPVGIPRTIDGRHVLRPTEAVAQVAGATDDSPFLLGGWVANRGMICDALPIPPLPPPFIRCNSNFLDSGPTTQSKSIAITPVRPGQVAPGAVVLEVHTHDWHASGCAVADHSYCLDAVVVDRVAWRQPTPPRSPVVGARFADGIPSMIDGESVLRPADAVGRARSATDDSTFLVGGWRRGPVAYSCPPQGPVSSTETSPLVPRCGDYMIDEEPIPGPTEAQARLVGFGLALPPEDGPAVFRIHVHDQRAANCAIVYRPTCEQALVVDSVVWTGDAVTATSPLTIEEVLRRLAIDSREMTATPFNVASRGSTGCDPGWPPQSWVAAYRGPTLARTAYIWRILVFPDSVAAQSVRPRLSSDGGYSGIGAHGTTCAMVIDGLNSSAWILVDNVIVEVSYPIGDEPALVGQVRTALKSSLP